MNKRRFLALFLVVALLLPSLALAAPEVSPAGEFPIVKEPLTLRIAVGQGPTQPDFEDIVILKNFEEKSGIDIEWDNVPSSMLTERRNIMFNSLDLPDIMMRMNIPALDQANYASQGLLLPLDDLIDKYAPNIKAWFEKYPELPLGLTLADGHIYTLPYIYESPAITCGQRAFFRKDALEAVGMEVPTTLDGYYDLLKAFKGLDYNKNGQADEFPLSVNNYATIEWFLKGSFGLGNRGTRHEYVDVDPETNQLRFIYTTERYKALLEYYHKLFADGLVDPEIFTYSEDGDFGQLIAKVNDGRAISYLFLNHTFGGQDAIEQAVGMYEPFEGPLGDKQFTYFGSVLNGAGGAGGTFAIMKGNPSPEASIRWVDYWYSDEGIREYFMGIEGVTYEVKDGEYVYTDAMLNDPSGVTFEQMISKYVPWVTVSNPSVAHSLYFKGGEMIEPAKGSALALHKYSPENIWPVMRLDTDTSEEMNALLTDIRTYRNENRAAFITGAKSFDQWDEYVKGYEKLGLDRYMEIYQDFISSRGWK